MSKRVILESISVEQVIIIVKDLIQPKHLNEVQDLILRQAYLGKTYEEIANNSGYSIQHIRDVGYKLWKYFSTVLGQKITKTNIQFILAQKIQQIESRQIHLTNLTYSLPEGPVSLNSPFYIKRSDSLTNISVEDRSYNAIIQPGALVRIKAPRQMGKTSLTIRILAYAANINYNTVRLNFSQAERTVFDNLDKFLRWFCANITRQLMLPCQIEDYWDEDLGSKVSCTSYFQGYILQHLERPLVLALDEVDRIFEFRDLATEFLPLLRFWHEEAKNLAVWQQLRLIVVHSTEVYIPLKINSSPFNVGLPIRLTELDRTQVKYLAKLYGCNFFEKIEGNDIDLNSLIAMVGGHPYLIRLAFYHLSFGNLNLSNLLKEAPTESGIYRNHLRRHLVNLQANPELATAMKKVVIADTSVELEPVIAYKLDSMGLIKLDRNRATPRCKLYALYLRSQS